MVAFIKKRIKKSTISAINLCAKDGIMYSRPVTKTDNYPKFYSAKAIYKLNLHILSSQTNVQEAILKRHVCKEHFKILTVTQGNLYPFY